MATIGSVTKRDDGRYEGELRTLSIRAEIAIVPVTDKASPNQPDYRVVSQGIEIGAGLGAQGTDVRQGLRLVVDRGTGVRRQDALRQSGSRCRAVRPGRLRLIWSPQD